MNQVSLQEKASLVRGAEEGSAFKGGFGDFSTFHKGTLAECMLALLLLQDDLAKISAMYSQQELNQIVAASYTAQSLAKINEAIGKDEMGKMMLAQGVGNIVGGAVPFLQFMHVKGNFLYNPLRTPEETRDIEGHVVHIDNAKKYQEAIGLRGGAAGGIGDLSHPPSQTEELLSRDFGVTPLSQRDKALVKTLDHRHAERLEDRVNQYIQKEQGEKTQIEQNATYRFQRTYSFVQAAEHLLTGGANGAASGFASKQGVDSAQKGYGDQALQLQNGTISDQRDHKNKTIEQAYQVNQTLIELGRCNAIRG